MDARNIVMDIIYLVVDMSYNIDYIIYMNISVERF